MDTLLARRSARASAILAIWTVNGLVWTSQTLVSAGLEGRSMPPRAALITQMGMAYTWALLTPLILWLGRRFPLVQRSWPTSLAVHVGASLTLSFPLNVLKVLLARWSGRYQAMS